MGTRIIMKMGTEVNKEIEREVKIITIKHKKNTSTMRRTNTKNRARTIVTRGTKDSNKMDNK